LKPVSIESVQKGKKIGESVIVPRKGKMDAKERVGRGNFEAD